MRITQTKRPAGAIAAGLFRFQPETRDALPAARCFVTQPVRVAEQRGRFPCFIGSPSSGLGPFSPVMVARLRIGSASVALLFETVQARPPTGGSGDGSPSGAPHTATGRPSDTSPGQSATESFRGILMVGQHMCQRICDRAFGLLCQNIAARDIGDSYLRTAVCFSKQIQTACRVAGGTASWPASTTIRSDDRPAPSLCQAHQSDPAALVQAPTRTPVPIFFITTFSR